MTVSEADAIARRAAKPLSPTATEAERVAAMDAHYRRVATLLFAAAVDRADAKAA